MKINRIYLVLFVSGIVLLFAGLSLAKDDTIRNIVQRTYRCDRLTKEALPTDAYCGSDYTRAPEYDNYKLIGSVLQVLGATDMLFALILWVKHRDHAST